MIVRLSTQLIAVMRNWEGALARAAQPLDLGNYVSADTTSARSSPTGGSTRAMTR